MLEVKFIGESLEDIKLQLNNFTKIFAQGRLEDPVEKKQEAKPKVEEPKTETEKSEYTVEDAKKVGAKLLKEHSDKRDDMIAILKDLNVSKVTQLEEPKDIEAFVNQANALMEG